VLGIIAAYAFVLGALLILLAFEARGFGKRIRAAAAR
jgi:hypothetical protein